MVETGLLLPRWCGGDSKSVVCWGWHSVGVGEVVGWFVMAVGCLGQSVVPFLWMLVMG